jgi:hypothetical protein
MNACRILVVKTKRNRPLGRPRLMRYDNSKMDLREIGWVGMDWIDHAQDRDQWRALVNTVMNLRVPLNVGKILEYLSYCRLFKKDSASWSWLELCPSV